jgi:MAE_28990/MAE_18760-like HEPN
MRSPEEVYEDIENDRGQREREIRLIENIAARTDDGAEREMLRRSLILLTYAHFEGFCKFALLAYASAVNALGLPCRDACTPLVAATLGKVFAALRDANSKHEVFARSLPDDRDLHLLARQRSFIDNYETIVSRRVELRDSLIDTKSNLNSLVLKRNLYQLGLDYPVIDTHRGSIDKLLGVRNAIAHGDALKVPTAKEVDEYTAAAFEVMRFVQQEVYDALRSQAYRKVPESDAA